MINIRKIILYFYLKRSMIYREINKTTLKALRQTWQGEKSKEQKSFNMIRRTNDLSFLDPFEFDKNKKSTKNQQNGCLIVTTSSITEICLTTFCECITSGCHSYTCRWTITFDNTKCLRFLNKREDFDQKRWRNHTYYTIRIGRNISCCWDTWTCCIERIITASTTWDTQIAIESGIQRHQT
jgi:hypothetical protein